MISERLNVSQTKIKNYLKCFGFTKELDIWMQNGRDLLNTANQYLLYETEPFVKKITGR